MRRFPTFLVVFTGTARTAPVVFYQLKTYESYRTLMQFIDRHPHWEVTSGWSKRRFHLYRTERLKQGLTTPHFFETKQGWLRVPEAHWPLAAAPKEDILFAPSFS